MKNYGSHKKSNRPDRRRTRITNHLHPTSSSSPTAHKMSQELTILGISAAITAVIQLSGFAVAYKFQTETFYDILGGINFLTLGIYSAIDGTSSSPFFSSSRKVAATAIFLVSRGWLLLFLAWRAHERKGDGRFDEIKTSFVWFLVAWVFQGVWVFTISLPVIFVNGSDNVVNDDGNWSGLEYCAMVGFALGVFFEIFADVQKAKWVKQGRNGGFCTVGVWKYSRHPNYFGEIFQWWCIWLFSYGSSTGVNDIQWWCSILSPIMTMQILLNTPATGVMNANGKNLKRYYDNYAEEYAVYRNKTSILIPLPFGIYEFVPIALKRTIFFDFKCYEYIPGGDDEETKKNEADDEIPNEKTEIHTK